MALMFLSRKRNSRSNINLSHVSVTTLAPGNLVPISFTRVITGDRISFNPKSFVQAFPMSAPLVNGFKLCLEYFFIPDRLYNNDMLLDSTGVTQDPENVEFPRITAPTSFSSGVVTLGTDDGASSIELGKAVVTPGSLADYMGFPVGYLPTASGADNGAPTQFNAIRALGYLDVIYNYYINQQIPEIPTALWEPKYKDKPGGVYPGSVESNFRLKTYWIFDLLRQVKSSLNPDLVIQDWLHNHVPGDFKGYAPMSWQWLCSRASIFQRCLPPYYLESWLQSSGYNDSEIKIDLDTDPFPDGSPRNSISVRNMQAQSHIQRWLDLALAGGSRYSDYMNSEFDTSSVKNTTSPLFLGSDRQFLGSNVLYQTTGFGDTDSPLGSFAGQCAGGNTFKRRSYKFGENGHFMVMASLVPDVIYSRNLDPFLKELTLADCYVPALDNIAMEPLLVSEVDAIAPCKSLTHPDSVSFEFTLTPDDQRVGVGLGFVPAWSKLLQNVSRSHGRMTTELAYWMLQREYGDSIETADMTAVRNALLEQYNRGDFSAEIYEACICFLDRLRENNDYTPYVLSNAYNNVFADISNQAQNFVLTFSCDMTANREKGKTNVSTTL